MTEKNAQNHSEQQRPPLPSEGWSCIEYGALLVAFLGAFSGFTAVAQNGGSLIESAAGGIVGGVVGYGGGRVLGILGAAI